jgi:hypothetical protein
MNGILEILIDWGTSSSVGFDYCSPQIKIKRKYQAPSSLIMQELVGNNGSG